MHRFAPALRRVAGDLDLPSRVRTALLLEMAADLESMFEHYRSTGLAEAVAAQRAEEAVLGSPEVIHRLVRIHASQRGDWWLDVGASVTRGAGAVLLAAGVVPMLALAGAVSSWVLMGGSTPLIWPILLVGVVQVGAVAIATARLVAGHPVPRRAPAVILVLSAIAPALGILALSLGVQAVAAGLPAVADQSAIASRIAGDGAALLMGLVLGISGLIGWFLLLHLESRRADREVEALLSGTWSDHQQLCSRRESSAVLPLVRRRQ